MLEKHDENINLDKKANNMGVTRYNLSVYVQVNKPVDHFPVPHAGQHSPQTRETPCLTHSWYRNDIQLMIILHILKTLLI